MKFRLFYNNNFEPRMSEFEGTIEELNHIRKEFNLHTIAEK